MLLHDVVEASRAVTATRSRKAKVAAMAEALGQARPEEAALAASYLAGTVRQRRTGVGWRSLRTLPDPAKRPTLTLLEVDQAFEALSGLAGAGSQRARAAALRDLLERATIDEQHWLRGAILGEVRQGALDSLIQEALALAAGVPADTVRRAAMLAGSTDAIAAAALAGGAQALAEVRLEVLRPLRPMLAASAGSTDEAVAKVADAEGVVAVDRKLDGIRIQVHRHGDEVLVATRSLDVITERLPEVVTVARSLRSPTFVLDGEALALDDRGRPRPFQDTSARTAMTSGVQVSPFFFDLLHLDGTDLLDAPAHERAEALAGLVPEQHRVPRVVTSEAEAVQAFLAESLAAGHEGVVVKSVDAPYAAGRRGSGWVKVKPVHTLDLVVLAVEWGSGRRRGRLSNIHLGARDPDGGFVMLGKTFKGMTDEMLAWQTERFLELETHREGQVVHVRPEQVVEIAFDGVQRSPRYPGGVALRFARVVRYRDDKRADEADDIDAVRALLP